MKPTDHDPHHDDERVFDLSTGMISVKPETFIRLLWGVIGVGVAALGFTAKFAWDANTALNALTTSMKDLRVTINERTSDRWTLSMMRKHDDEMRLKNPMLVMPDADDVHNRLSPK